MKNSWPPSRKHTWRASFHSSLLTFLPDRDLTAATSRSASAPFSGSSALLPCRANNSPPRIFFVMMPPDLSLYRMSPSAGESPANGYRSPGFAFSCHARASATGCLAHLGKPPVARESFVTNTVSHSSPSVMRTNTRFRFGVTRNRPVDPLTSSTASASDPVSRAYRPPASRTFRCVVATQLDTFVLAGVALSPGLQSIHDQSAVSVGSGVFGGPSNARPAHSRRSSGNSGCGPPRLSRSSRACHRCSLPTSSRRRVRGYTRFSPRPLCPR